MRRRGVSCAVLLAAAAAACGGVDRVDRLPPAAQTRLMMGAAHAIVVRRSVEATEVLVADRHGVMLARTALAPEAFDDVVADDRVIVDRIAGRVRGRLHGDVAPRWTWPPRGEAREHALRGPDVLVLDSDGRLCLLDAVVGTPRDCAAMPADAGRPPGERQLRLVGAGRIGEVAWAWLRTDAAVAAIVFDRACAGDCPGRREATRWWQPLSPDRPLPLLLGDGLWLQPSEGVLELRDGRTGHLRHRTLAPRLGSFWIAGGAVVVAGVREDGPLVLAALAPDHATVRWERGIEELPVDVAEGRGVVRLRGRDGGETVLAAASGALLGRLPPARVAVASEEVWVGVLADGSVALSALAPAAASALADLPGKPALWRSGTTLHYLVQRPGVPPWRLALQLQDVTASGARLQFAGSDGAPRQQVWDAAALRSNRTLCMVPRPGDVDTDGCPAVVVGSEVAAGWRRGAAESLQFAGRFVRATRSLGRGWARVQLRQGSAAAEARLVPVLHVAPSDGEGRWEIGGWPELPLLVHAERDGWTLTWIGASIPASDRNAAAP